MRATAAAITTTKTPKCGIQEGPEAEMSPAL